MLKNFIKVIVVVLVLGLGFEMGNLAIKKVPELNLKKDNFWNKITGINKPIIFGFSPYWLLDGDKNNYDSYMTDIAYFAVIVNSDGSIVKKDDKNQTEPGWNKLNNGGFDASRKMSPDLNYTLVVQSGVEDSIQQLIANPEKHADKLMSEIIPLLKKYKFNGVNLDIESLGTSDDTARANFTKFVARIKKTMMVDNLGELTVELPVPAFTKKTIIDPAGIEPYTDFAILMAYDYHYRGSMITGPVAPLGGAGDVSEVDVKTAVNLALKSFRSEKLILGSPFYGYEWETIDAVPQSGVIPGSGLTATQQRVQKLLTECKNCQVTEDEITGEKNIIYKDEQYGSYHQIYFGDTKSLQQKVQLAKDLRLGGIAFWALGYETDAVKPILENYQKWYWTKD